jgi:hypothetical protein
MANHQKRAVLSALEPWLTQGNLLICRAGKVRPKGDFVLSSEYI